MSLLLFSQHTMPDPTSVSASTNMIVGFGGDGGGPTPVFTLPLQNLTVQVGRNATFTCYVRHIQRYQVSRSSRAQRRGGREGERKQVPHSSARFGCLQSLRGRNCPSSIISVHLTSDVVSPSQPALRCCSGEGSNDIGLALPLSLDSLPFAPLGRIPLNY